MSYNHVLKGAPYIDYLKIDIFSAISEMMNYWYRSGKQIGLKRVFCRM